MSEKRSIKLEFEYVARPIKADDPHLHGGTEYAVKPLHDHDFWDAYFPEKDADGFSAVLHMFQEIPEEHALKTVALRLHDVATGKAYAHGLQTEVQKSADFVDSKGAKISVAVPKMVLL